MTTLRGRYAGIPYRDGGRSVDGADCWGLVRLAYLAEAGIVLPSFSEISSKDLRAVARAIDAVRHGGVAHGWSKVPADEPLQALDVAVMTHPGHAAPVHVGVYDGAGRILHTETETDAAYTRLDHPSLSGRVLGFWRRREPARAS